MCGLAMPLPQGLRGVVAPRGSGGRRHDQGRLRMLCNLTHTTWASLSGYLYTYSMIKFFVLDGLLRRVVAVSSDPAPDSAFAPSFFGRASGQLP